jgi:hypothetical protein
LQRAPSAQSRSLVQVVLQASVVGLQTYGWQEIDVLEQAPFSQLGAINDSPKQAAVPHAPVAAAQAPLPSQAPSQAACSPVQSPPGSVPLGASAHVPSPPGSAHVRQVSPQRVPQQTPSLQKPLAHWPSPVHGVPLGLAPMHRPLLQVAPPAHSVSAMQDVLHAVPAASH